MKSIIQNLSNGKISLIEAPKPAIKNNGLIIATKKSLISSGTEKMLIDFGKANYLDKARQQPEKVKKALDKMKTDGVFSTVNSIRSRLDEPLSLGYCNAGIVLETTNNKYKIGDRVASNGPHSEIVSVSNNLCAKIPENVTYESASYTVMGSISLQGIRLLNPGIGENIVVMGLGLVGLLSVQILRANGCKVLGVDYNTSRCNLAKSFGAEVFNLSDEADLYDTADYFSKGNGVDGVLITASTKSSDPVHQAAKMCRKRGKIVLVGVTGLDLKREDFYEKELTFQVSCSYGPGRYDLNYEKLGLDYPYGFVRWTEQRNFEAVLQLISEGKIDTKSLTTHQFPFTEAYKAYETVQTDKESLGVVFNYDSRQDKIFNASTIQIENLNKKNNKLPTIGFIGAGTFSRAILIPAFKLQKVNFKTLASFSGLNSTYYGKKFGFNNSTTDLKNIFDSETIDTVVIASRHDSHADLALKGIKAKKNIFIEKPLCINIDQHKAIESEMKTNPSINLMIGFNRRFSPFISKIKDLLKNSQNPISMIMTVNAGSIPKDHWIHNKKIGGGRIIGEACHFIDLLRFLAESRISNYSKTTMTDKLNDTLTINLSFENGSIGAIHYFTNGHNKLQKEKLEIFSNGRYLSLDNFKRLSSHGFRGFNKTSFFSQNKGHKECVKAFIESIKNNKSSPIPFDEILEVSRISIDLSKEE